MSSSRKTIFDLERRSDLVSDFRFTVVDLEKTMVTTKSFGNLSLKQLLNDCIKTWPYRQGASSIPSYASAKGFDIYDIDDNCYNEDELSNLFELSHGVSVAVDMSGSDTDHGVYASAYREVVSFFEHLVKKEQLYTLCFFVEQTEKPGFTKSLVAAVQDSVHMIEIKEGKGDKARASEFLRILTSNSRFDATAEEIDKALPQRKSFSSSEVYEIYNKWFSNGLKSKKYRAYKE